MVAVTRWRYGWLPYLVAFAFGIFLPSLTGAMLVAFLLTFVPVFWLATYLTVPLLPAKIAPDGRVVAVAHNTFAERNDCQWLALRWMVVAISLAGSVFVAFCRRLD